MLDMDSNAYKVLKKLSKAENSRGFSGSDSYWLGYLHKHNLVTHGFIKVSEHESLGVYFINEQGRSTIKDHRKRTAFKWFVSVLLPVIAIIIGVVTL
ncbi:MAG: hypothetical protein ACYCX2_05285 [Christensenellales bacterium]